MNDYPPTSEQIRHRALRRRERVLAKYAIMLIGCSVVMVVSIILFGLSLLPPASLLIEMVLTGILVAVLFWRGMEALSKIHQETMHELDLPHGR